MGVVNNMHVKKSNLKILTIAVITSTLLVIFNRSDFWFVDLLSFVVGVFLFAFAARLADARLRKRNKSIAWLPLFFGPILVAIILVSRIDPDDDRLILLTIIISSVLALPTAIWGVVELTSAPKSKDN